MLGFVLTSMNFVTEVAALRSGLEIPLSLGQGQDLDSALIRANNDLYQAATAQTIGEQLSVGFELNAEIYLKLT